MKIGPGASSGGGMAQAILGGRELAQQRRHGKRQQRMAGAQLGLGIGKAVADLGVSITHLIQQAQRNAIYESEQKDRERHNKWVEAGGLKMPEDMPEDPNWRGPPPEVPIDIYRARSERKQAEAKAKEPSLADTMVNTLRANQVMEYTKGMPLDLAETVTKEKMAGITGPGTTKAQALKRAMASLKSAYPSEKFGDWSPISPEYSGLPETDRPQRVAQLARLVLRAGLSEEDRRAALDSIRGGMGNVDLEGYLGGLEQKIGAGKGWKQGPLRPSMGGWGPEAKDPFFGLHDTLHSTFPSVPELPWTGGKPPHPMPTADDRAWAQALQKAWYPQGVLKPPPAQPAVGGNPMTFPFRGLLDSFRQRPIPPQGQR